MNDFLPKPFTPDDLHRKIFNDLKIKPNKATKEKKPAAPRKNFDFTYLRSMSDNNEEFIKEMIQTFVQTMPGILSEMNECLKQKNWLKLSKLAHQIKPSFTLLGIHELRTTIVFIEENGGNQSNLSEVTSTTTKFIEACHELMKDFTNELAAFE